MLVLKSIEDPRDNLQKAKRSELYAFAQQNGVKEIDHDGMPAELMRTILRSKNLTNIAIPRRVLGQPEPRQLRNSNGAPLSVAQQTPAENVVEMDATADLMRQYQAERARQAEPASSAAKPYEQMTRAELAKTCKARGIAMSRTDKKETLMEKLRGKDAA